MPTYYYICESCRSIYSAMTLNKMVELELPCPCGNFLTFGNAGHVSPEADPIFIQETETPLWQVRHAYEKRVDGSEEKPS